MNKLQAVLLRRWPVVLIATLLGAAVGVLSGLTAAGEASRYQAEQVIVANQIADTQASVVQDALKVTRGRVPVAAAKALGRPADAEALAQDVTAEADVQSFSITVTGTGDSPRNAVDTVSAFTDAFLEVVNADLSSEGQRQLDDLKAKVDAAEKAIDDFDTEHPEVTQSETPLVNSPTVAALINERRELVNTLSSARDQYDTFRISFSQRQPYSTLGEEPPKLAKGPFLQVPTSPIFRGLFLGVLGLFLGGGLVLGLERLNRRIDTRSELAEVTGAPVIAEIPAVGRKHRPRPGPSGHLELDGSLGEHYRRVRSTIQFIQNQHLGEHGLGGPAPAVNGNGSTAPGDRVFLFTSAMPDEGKSTSAVLTALALAEAGTETLAVDADFRKPSLVGLLGVAPSPNLDDLAQAGLSRANIHATVQPTSVAHLWAAVAGPPSQSVFHRLVAARGVIAEGASRGGTVIIDSAPLRAANDTIDLLPAVDHVVLVVRAGKATRSAVKDAVDLLATYDASLAGIVLVGARDTRDKVGYYYVDTAGAAARAGAGKGFTVVGQGLPTVGGPPPR